MQITSFKTHLSAIVFLPVALLSIVFWVANNSEGFGQISKLDLAISVDLFLVIPGLYFLLIRKTAIPNITVIPLCVVIMLLSTVILPESRQDYLELFKTYLIPFLELGFISYVFYSLRMGVLKFKKEENADLDFYSNAKNTLTELLPRAFVIPVLTEISVFYYGFFLWRKKPFKENEFTIHKESGSMVLLSVVMFLLVVETFVFHLLLEILFDPLAWILTFISIYSGFQLFGFIKSIPHRRSYFSEKGIHFRYGIMSETDIDFDQIEFVSSDFSTISKYENEKESRKLSLLGSLENHNVIIRLKKNHMWSGLYGTQKPYKNLLVSVDDKKAFISKVNQKLEEIN